MKQVNLNGFLAPSALALGITAIAARPAVIIVLRPVFTRARQIDFQYPAAKALAIEPVNGFIGFFLAVHRNKRKSLKTARVTVFNKSNLINRANLGK